MTRHINSPAKNKIPGRIELFRGNEQANKKGGNAAFHPPSLHIVNMQLSVKLNFFV